MRVATDPLLQISDNRLRKERIVTWPELPKRLQSGLKALCCLARSGREMQSREVAKAIDVSIPETAKILQLLVWGGFVTSRRGSKGGFQLATSPDQITMSDVIDFFLARHAGEPGEKSPVMLVLRDSMAPCQEAFGKLTLAEAALPRKGTRQERKLAGATRRIAHGKNRPPSGKASL
jgi:Rrf2 family protein